MSRRAFQSFVCFLSIGLAGCEHRDQQFELEARTVFGLMNMLRWYESDNPGVQVTNLSQLFWGLNRDYPYAWDKQFRMFGKDAGFRNSFFERYVFFPAGITNSHFDGQLVFMNAQPYPEARGGMERTVVFKAAGGYYRRTLGEERVQQLFKDAGIDEPRPLEMPPPPPAPLDTRYSPSFVARVRGFVLGILQANGLSAPTAWAVWRGLAVLFPLLFLVILIWNWQRIRPRRLP